MIKVKVITGVDVVQFEQGVNNFVKEHEGDITKIIYSTGHRNINNFAGTEFVAFIELDDHTRTVSESWGGYSESGAAKTESFEEYKTYKGVRICDSFGYVGPQSVPDWAKGWGNFKSGNTYALLESGDIVCISL